MDITSYLLGKKAGGGGSGMINYTTEEQEIGTWIDGKKIYRKVIPYHNDETLGAKPGVTEVNIPHGITNFDHSVGGVEAMCLIYDVWVYLPIFQGNRNNNNYGLYSGTCITNVTDTNIVLEITNDKWSPRDWYFIMEYTKKTN